jgi:hypothetical protein
MTNRSLQSDLPARLDASHERTLDGVREGRVGHEALVGLADLEAFFALNLDPMPIDPVGHLRDGYAKTRPYLEHLTRHDPAWIVPVGARDGYVYPLTPRKILRRVLDHTLDHFDQIDQWTDWRDHGPVPTPRDGWAPASVTFAEDTFPLAEDELAAWLWRIDRAVALLLHRAAGLTRAQLDWQPPEGWTLHRTLVWLRGMAGRGAPRGPRNPLPRGPPPPSRPTRAAPRGTAAAEHLVLREFRARVHARGCDGSGPGRRGRSARHRCTGTGRVRGLRFRSAATAKRDR